MADNFPNSLPRLLKNIPEVYPKLMGTVVNAPLPYRKNASNVVNIMDAVSYATDEALQTVAEGKQQSLIGVSPVQLADASKLNTAIDEIALPGYLFTIGPVVPSSGIALGYPRNLSKSFYITLKNSGPSSVSIPYTVKFGNFLDFNNPQLKYASTGITTDGSYFYITDLHDGPSTARVIKTTLDGSYVTSFRSWGSGVYDHFFAPYDITYFDGFLYILDSGLCRIIQMDTLGNIAGIWGSQGSGNTEMASPYGITNDGTDLYITDCGNDRVFKLPMPLPSPSTPFTASSGSTNLNIPIRSVIVGSYLYICDSHNYRIVQLDKSLAPGPFYAYWASNTNIGIAQGITTDGVYLYIVTDLLGWSVLKVSAPLPSPSDPWAARFTIPDLPAYSFLQGTTISGADLFICNMAGSLNAKISVLDSVTGNLLTSGYNFSFSTPKTVTIPSGGTATLQYIPNPDNPHTVVGTYSLVSCSFLPLTPNYNITNDYGADDSSYTLPDQPNCIEQIGNGFSVPRIYNEFLANYKNRIKLQAFGAKIAPVSILSFLKKVYPLDSNLKIYEWFTQSDVNTGFSDSRKNTSQSDLLSFITGYVGAYGAFQLDSNTGLLTSIPNLITFLGSSHPHYMYVVFTNSTFENRGTFSAGDSGISGYSGYSGYTGSYGSMFDLFSSIPTSPKDANITKTFHSGLTQPTTGAPGEATFGGFLDTEQYSATSPAQRMAFLVNSMKAAGITAVLVQLGS